MCVSFSIKKEFCQHIKKDYENDVLRCWEIRLEEIIEYCVTIDKKICRNQKNIAARRKRTGFFESEIFRNRAKRG
jgi:hypothetical protein